MLLMVERLVVFFNPFGFLMKLAGRMNARFASQSMYFDEMLLISASCGENPLARFCAEKERKTKV
jgi:hypothetical protein